MHFCPLCGTLLFVESCETGVQFFCRTCPYIHAVHGTVNKEISGLKRKEVDDVMGGEEQWELANSTQASCPKCTHGEAYFFEMQTRSADEPATTFYRCANAECAHQWKEN